VVREADVGNGIDTIRPIKKVDAAGSLRLSHDFMGPRREGSTSAPPSPTVHKRTTSEIGKAGTAMLDEIVLPTIQKAIHDDMDAREIESLSMLSRGFTELKDVNPELAYNLVLDILAGINDNSAVRQHIQTSRGLFPHRRVIRKSEMTARGLVVNEVQEEIAGLPSTSGHINHSQAPSSASIKSDDSSSRKSPIAELLYMRWLEGLKIKWPSIL